LDVALAAMMATQELQIAERREIHQPPCAERLRPPQSCGAPFWRVSRKWSLTQIAELLD